MLDTMRFNQIKITWLEGGVTHLDGGAMFGVVPKVLWSKKYPSKSDNLIQLPTDPMLLQSGNKNYLVDTGIGNGKLSDKQKKIFGVTKESSLLENLTSLGLTANDIGGILMTHMHYDHANGLTYKVADTFYSTFPNATIYIQRIEWEELTHPNIRSKSTYWKTNWETIKNQVQLFDEEIEIEEGIKLIHTGGHSEGHCILQLHQNDQMLYHLADIMPTHAHQNPLWVTAYDDYPMTSIYAKEKLLKEAYMQKSFFLFYHDAYYRMIQWDQEGKEILSAIKREQKHS